MDSSEFVERVESENATRLDRLGSEKALVAATEAALDRETVLAAAAAAEARAAATFESWEADETDERAREAFAAAAERERDHLEQVCEVGDVGVDVGEPPADALHGHLRDLEATVPRAAAGLVGRPLVAARSLLQVINFFVNEGDGDAADAFRDLRAETEAQAESGAEVVLAVCADGDDRERAVGTAGAAIDAAYGEYAETLEGLGIDPKPVC